MFRKIAAAAVLAFAAAGFAPAASLALEGPFPPGKPWALPQAFIMDRTYGSLDSCGAMQAAYEAQGWPRGVSPDVLDLIDRKLKKQVILRPDQGLDQWTPLAKTVIDAKRKPAADCDDVAITAAQLAICAGFPAGQLGLMVTQLPTRAKEFHLVAFYAGQGGESWVFGDTMGRPRPVSRLKQTVYYYAYFDSPTKWWALRDPHTGEALTGEVSTSSIPLAPLAEDAEYDMCGQ